MLSRVARTLAEHRLVGPNERVLVGLSGGPDSWALLLALRKLHGDGVEAACVDHRLRPESAAEARAVAARCKALGIRCAVLRVDIGRAQRPHVSLQEAARGERLRALARQASRRRCTRVALGHQADDQAETILFRIVRGTGVRGLAGIPYRRGVFVRPLLDVRRADILRFLRRQRFDYVSDPSNRDPRYTRVRVRHDWLPRLEQENPQLVDALLALSRDARAVTAPRTAAALERTVVRTVADTGGDVVYLNRRAAEVIDRLRNDPSRTTHVDVRGGRVMVDRGRAEFVPSKRARGR